MLHLLFLQMRALKKYPFSLQHEFALRGTSSKLSIGYAASNFENIGERWLCVKYKTQPAAIQTLDFLRVIDRSLPKPGSGAGYMASEYVFPLVLMLNGGGRSLEDMRVA
jgi:hypothetical protein